MRLILFCLLLATPAAAQNVPTSQAQDVLTREGRVDPVSGMTRVVFGTDFRAMRGDPAEAARAYLRARGDDLGLEGLDLAVRALVETPGGTTVRFVQRYRGLNVFDAEVAVTVAGDGRAAFVHNDAAAIRKNVELVAGKSTAAQAQVARDRLGIRRPEREVVESVVYVEDGVPRLGTRVELLGRSEVPGDWEVVVDVESGRILHLEDRATRRSPDRQIQRVDGTATVFDPDPLSRAGVAYGGAYADNNDAASPELTAQLVERPLRDLSFDGTVYALDGPYVRIVDVDVPLDGVFSQDSLRFTFTRSDPAFEAVNAYYHVDASLRYVTEELGFDVAPYQVQGPVRVDPHGWNGQDQSSYSPADALLNFGQGGVDDAEDADVVLHELGHALHDWLTQGGLSQVDGLSEGIGDYWANSYHRSLGLWAEGRPERAWVFHWDGHNEFFSGRTTAYDALYPGGMVDRIHTDGQIWASSMMEVWESLGRETTDRLMLQAMSMLGSTSSQSDAAFAVLQADTLLNAGANAGVLKDVFWRRGYLLRANFAASARAGTGPLTVQFFDASFAVGDGVQSREWDLDGDGVTDATGSTAQFTYERPGLYTVSLAVSDGTATARRVLTDFVSVNRGLYLWQGGDGQFDRSGDFLRNHFLVRGLTNAYSRSTNVHAPLAGYDGVFLSLGSFGTGPSRMDEGMAVALRNYMKSGGHVFLDGGEALGFDQAGNAGLLELFGLAGSDDGTSADTPVRELTGVAGSLADGLQFRSTSQLGVSWIDRYQPLPTAVAAFEEAGYGTVAVQHERPGGGKSFVMAYALGQLDDGDAPSTRAELIDRILAFFDVAGPTGAETAATPLDFALEAPYPNPAASTATVPYSLAAPARVRLEVFDLLGRRVSVHEKAAEVPAGRHRLTVQTNALPSGAYVVRLSAGERSFHQKLVVIR